MFSYRWRLADGYPAPGVPAHGSKVFSTFACGGGSSMGYKLAGYEVIGANDIDPRMEEIYRANHRPRLFYRCPVGDLARADLPPEMFDLDVLDGSPPCSTFSMSGLREKVWKKQKKFREGQAEQVLSDLFFDWIALVRRLRPKVAVAENVRGMLAGNAVAYSKAVAAALSEAGYGVQVFLLNSALMGLPQQRERVFFVCRRKDLRLPALRLSFGEKPINFSEIDDGTVDKFELPQKSVRPYWPAVPEGKGFQRYHPKGNFFNTVKVSRFKPCCTITSGGQFCHPVQMRILTKRELELASSFPSDYDYLGSKPQYVMGMSVPPVMMAHVAWQIYAQCLKAANNSNQ